ncbi:hypothetical protein GWI33_008027 [Rhynchophorus ferrugineus]|uniref:Uncharacterized protein n=1 Tax=Rhynchophorus ferrugineus TaxID=354439 RepID=A0A834J2B1_RHYFE|nr:hypothetical protein GWI33_008027 [Rhynchophorus ferrugineus]
MQRNKGMVLPPDNSAKTENNVGNIYNVKAEFFASLAPERIDLAIKIRQLVAGSQDKKRQQVAERAMGSSSSRWREGYGDWVGGGAGLAGRGLVSVERRTRWGWSNLDGAAVGVGEGERDGSSKVTELECLVEFSVFPSLGFPLLTSITL